MKDRTELQKQFSNIIIKSGFNGTCLISPRFGKTRTVIEALKGIYDWNIIVSTPRADINKNWKDECFKWGLGYFLKTICNNSLLKLKGEDIDLLIIDECHLLSDNQIKNINILKPKRLLLLTGTLGQGKLHRLKTLLKTELIVSYTIDDAINDGIIADYEINIIKIPLTPEERNSYTKITSRYEWCKEQGYLMAKINAARKRMFNIYNMKSKALAVNKFIEDYDRCLVFSSTTKTADIICEYSYHSKSNNKNLELFINNKIKKLAVCKMSDCGITFPDLKVGIIHQIQSSEEIFLQRALRCCNLEGDKIAKLFVFVCENTVDEMWLENCIKDIDKSKIKYIKYENK